MNPSTRRVIIGFLTGALLHFIVGQANHYLAAWQLHIWIGGLVVALPALRLSYKSGFWIVIFTGLLFDATTPVPFGLHALLFAIAHLLVHRVRARLASEENLIGILVALLLNLGLFIVFAFTRFTVTPDVGSAGLRLFSDLIVSQLFLALIAPWFFALQIRSLEISGAGLRDDPSVMI